MGENQERKSMFSDFHENSGYELQKKKNRKQKSRERRVS